MTDEQAAEIKFNAGMGALQAQRNLAFNEAAELASMLAVEQARNAELSAEVEKLRAAIAKHDAAVGAK